MSKIEIKDNTWVKTEIGSTNGIHYIDRANKIETYPAYQLPTRKAQKKNSLMLDIGSGWGRWLVAASKKNYIPIGLDLKWDHVDLQRGLLFLPDSKTGKKAIVLNAPAGARAGMGVMRLVGFFGSQYLAVSRDTRT